LAPHPPAPARPPGGAAPKGITFSVTSKAQLGCQRHRGFCLSPGPLGSTSGFSGPRSADFSKINKLVNRKALSRRDAQLLSSQAMSEIVSFNAAVVRSVA